MSDNNIPIPLEIDEAVQRYIAALDEIEYVAEQLAARMGIATDYEAAKDYLEGLHSRMEDLTQDVENIMLDAEGDSD